MKYASHRRGRAGALILGLAAAAAIAVPASASASTGASPVVGHVYVNDNTKGTNTIGAFDRHADGSLTPVAGSAFAAGGAGIGAGLASQGAIQITPDGRFLIAVDAGSNQISVLRIHFDGSLSLVSVTGSGGALPDSVAVHGHLVYVANSGVGDANYTGFLLGLGGRLFPIPGSTVTLAANAAPADVLFNGTGTKLVGTEVGTSVIDSFTVGFERPADRRPRIAVPGPGTRPVRQRVPADQPHPAVRVQRPQRRRRHRNRLRVRRLLQRDADLDRGLPVRGPADRPLLGGDHP